MLQDSASRHITPEPPGAPAREASAALGDLRFRALLGDDAWAALPSATRRRFSKRLQGGRTAVYVGTVTQTTIGRLGWWLAQMARLVGGPLPLSADAGLPSVVTVTEDFGSGGQNWTRLYARSSGFPQVIHSAKRFSGATGLEEFVHPRLSMALRLAVEDGALLFRSAGFVIHLFGRRLPLPRWALPGNLTVAHRALEGGGFTFQLDLTHPRLGPLMTQTAVFKETSA